MTLSTTSLKQQVSNKELKIKSGPKEWLLIGGFYATIFGLFCYLINQMIVCQRVTTIQLHISYSVELSQGIKRLPHLGFFYALWFFKTITGMSYNMSGTILLSIFATLNTGAIHYVSRKLVPGLSMFERLALTLITVVAGAIYLPFFNEAIYFGQGSPNMYHNATVIAVKWLVLLAAFAFLNFVENDEKQNSWPYAAIISVMMLLSIFIKPTFAIVFVPALGLHLLISHTKRFDLYWKSALIIIPMIPLLIYQQSYFDHALGHSEKARTNEIEFLTIWRLFTPNVGISILITIAFPLSLLIFRFKHVMHNAYLTVAWMTTLIGMLQFSMIAEYTSDGKLITSANWIGGYLMGLGLLFVFTIAEYAKWLKSEGASKKREKVKIRIASFLLCLHTFGGIYYIYELITLGRTIVRWQDR